MCGSAILNKTETKNPPTPSLPARSTGDPGAFNQSTSWQALPAFYGASCTCTSIFSAKTGAARGHSPEIVTRDYAVVGRFQTKQKSRPPAQPAPVRGREIKSDVERSPTPLPSEARSCRTSARHAARNSSRSWRVVRAVHTASLRRRGTRAPARFPSIYQRSALSANGRGVAEPVATSAARGLGCRSLKSGANRSRMAGGQT